MFVVNIHENDKMFNGLRYSTAEFAFHAAAQYFAGKYEIGLKSDGMLVDENDCEIGSIVDEIEGTGA